jgi:glycerate dehydrogenase
MQAAFLDFDTLGPGDIDPAPLMRLLPELRLFADTPREEVAARLRETQIVIVNKIALGRALIAQAPRLRLICLAATGTDNVALDAARERGIAVANIRNYCAPSVTQHVFALLLGLNQRLREYDALVADGAWSRTSNFCLLDYPFAELAGRTLGIVGLGNLGRAVARVAQAFGMTVIAAQRPGHGAAGEFSGNAPDGVERVAFAALLARSHVVSLHCPLTAETRGLIDGAALGRMRRDSLLINTARGALVDAPALVAALRERTIAGAGIDVLDAEPPPADHPLLAARLPNLIVTPHIAWAAREARQRALEEIAANVRAFLAGESRNRVA